MRVLVISNHPGTTCHPSNGGELGTCRRGVKFPSAEGCRRIGPRENAIFVGDKSTGWSLSPTPRRAKRDTPRPPQGAVGILIFHHSYTPALQIRRALGVGNKKSRHLAGFLNANQTI